MVEDVKLIVIVNALLVVDRSVAQHAQKVVVKFVNLIVQAIVLTSVQVDVVVSAMELV